MTFYIFKKRKQTSCYCDIITRAQPNLNCFKLSVCLDYNHPQSTHILHNRAHSLSKLNTEEAKPNTVKKEEHSIVCAAVYFAARKRVIARARAPKESSASVPTSAAASSKTIHLPLHYGPRFCISSWLEIIDTLRRTEKQDLHYSNFLAFVFQNLVMNSLRLSLKSTLRGLLYRYNYLHDIFEF